MKKTNLTYDPFYISFVVILLVTTAVGIGFASGVFTQEDQVEELTQQEPGNAFWSEIAERGSVAGVDRAIGPSPELEAQADRYGQFIGIDLNAMELYWYENGRIAHTYPILLDRGELTEDELPAGQHRIHYRNERHLSAKNGTRNPYTQQFYRNISVYGQPQGAGEIGGGIPLRHDDAQRLYDLASQDTPVIVSYGNEIGETLSSSPPPVSAQAYIIADIDTGEVIAHKRSRRSLAIASITKLMTAVVARENNRSSDPVYISPNAAATYGNSGGLSAGEAFGLSTLYLPLLLDSSNDAATAIAEHYGYDRFMELMNQKARTLGMRTTIFDDPSGLSDLNTSTGHDLLRLARYIWSYHRSILDTTTEIMSTTPDPYSDGLRNFTNNNPVVGMDNYHGGKNGYTDRARHTLLSIYTVDAENSSRNIVVIVLGAENRGDDTKTLLRWIKGVI
ncbi:MAG: L,D-transpeptidase family protein [Candidatus Paceibacterota bacterium]